MRYDPYMTQSRWNWPLWTGLILSVIAFLSYFLFFALFPITRDIPWANFLLFAVAIALLVAGIRRGRIVAWIAGLLGIGIAVFFTWVVLVGAKDLPASHGAPRVGQKAPDFTLLDTNRKPVSLSQVLSTAPRGAVLVFYRGYW